MRTKMTWISLVLMALLLALSPRAEAFYNEGTKAGPIMLNLKIGVAIDAYSGIYGNNYYFGCTYNYPYGYPYPYPYPTGYYGCGVPAGFTLELDAGFAITPDRAAYLLVPLQFEFFPGVNVIMIPFGFQYDIPIKPVPGLYIYPRFSIGYAPFVGGYYGTGALHDGFVMPEFGAKYVLHKRWNFTFEPFNLPIFFGQTGPLVHYRLMWGAGVNL